jgi:exodeoxyribonuclease V alpha subunit
MGNSLMIENIFNGHANDLNTSTEEVMEPLLQDGFKSWIIKSLKLSASICSKIIFAENPYATILKNFDLLDSRKKYGVLSYWNKIENLSPHYFFLMGLDFGHGESRIALNRLMYSSSSQKLPSLEDLKKNPYMLVGYGIAFNKIDHAAIDMLGLSPNTPYRIVGYLKHMLQTESMNGHLFLKIEDFILDLNNRLHTDYDIVKLQELIDQYGNDMVTINNGGVYISSNFFYEDSSSYMVSKFIYTHKENDSINIHEFINDYQKNNEINFSELQYKAVIKAFEHNMFVLTGLPGTGKTTLTKCLCYLFRRLYGENPLLLTPTGVAARNLQMRTGMDSSTIHRALGYQGDKWLYNKYNKLDFSTVIVDEVSMVDQQLFYRLLSALNPETTRLILIGDAAQLPSVGAGNVLRDLVKSKSIENVFLQEIFRQNEASDIIINAHRINKGEGLLLTKNPPDFIFIEEKDKEKIQDKIIKITNKLYLEEKEFQVLSPMYKPQYIGVDALNQILKGNLNKESQDGGEINLSGVTFKVNDRVIVTKNNYKYDVFNGDIGKIKEIDYRSGIVKIKLFKPIRYIELGIRDDSIYSLNLKLAYCITVHKVQGLEFEYIIIPISKAFRPLLQRNLLYTGVTRARSKIIIIGDPEALGMAIANNRPVLRNTMLSERLNKYLSEDIKCESIIRDDKITEDFLDSVDIPF